MDNNTPQADIVEKTVDEELSPDASKSPSKRERHRLSYYFTGGIIMSLLGALTESVYKALRGGFFGRIFTAYSAEQSALGDGYIAGRVFRNEKLHGYSRNARRVFAEAFENSFFLGIMKKIFRVLLETSVKNYGNYMLSFGLYTVFVYFVKRFIAAFETADTGHFLAGMIFVMVSVPMLMSKSSLAEALGESISARAILCDVFGMRDESFDVPPKQSKARANLAIIIGMVSGALTFFVPPLYIPLAVLLAVLVSMIMVTPEIGVIISLFVLPFLSLGSAPSLLLASLVAVSGIGYVIKLIRGKRIVKLEIIDAAVLLFSFITFFSGMVSAGGSASLYEAILACIVISVYFLVTNMMRTRKWIDRCVLALVSAASVTAVIGVLEYFFGDISTQWLDTTYFDDIRGRVVSLFDNSNVLAFYLVLAFPFALDLIFKYRNRGERFLASFSSAAIVLCVVFTWSRGAWIGLIVATVVYLLIRTRGVIKALFGFCLAIPILAIVLPSNIINRFMSIGDLADSSTYYRVLTWQGSLEAIRNNLFGGYGYGTSAFESVYPRYASAGIEAAEHSHSLFLQIIFGMGLIGLVTFLLVILFFAQKTLEFFKRGGTGEDTGVSASAFAAVLAALVMGLFDNIWYNSRVMFLFWAVIGIACATVRMTEEASRRRQVEVVCDKTSAYIDI